jgi:hypothetical protein
MNRAMRKEIAMADTQAGGRADGMRARFRQLWRVHLLHVLGGSLLVCLAVSFFFSPRFVIWRGLDIPEAWFNPEVNRAVDTLKQLRDPFVKIENPSNQVINWRLFFPLLGHWLHLPVGIFLALPHLGCVLAVGYLEWLVHRRTGRWLWALLAAGAVASADWFFVSMGWLTYFDSWFVLGLLIVSFAQSRVAIGIACLVEPWIDERFILALPVCVVVRMLVEREWRKRGWRALGIEVGIIAVLTMPYVVARGVLMLGSDTGSTSYLQDTLRELQTVPASRLLDGLWSGFRMAWVYAVVVVVWIWRQHRGWLCWVALGVIGVELGLGLVVAGDVSRNLAMLLPVVVLGVLVVCEKYPHVCRVLLPGLAAANLLLPAAHVVWSFRQPIYYFYHELAAWREPPPFVNPVAYVNEGVKLLNAGRAADARRFFDNALRLNSQQAEAHLGRGVANLTLQDLNGAQADFDRALELRPRWGDALYFRGLALARVGARDAAIRDLDMALGESGHDWPHRKDCQTVLDELRRR